MVLFDSGGGEFPRTYGAGGTLVVVPLFSSALLLHGHIILFYSVLKFQSCVPYVFTLIALRSCLARLSDVVLEDRH